MLKKLILSSVVCLLTACSSHQDTIPAQFAGADYQLSDADAKRWVEIANQAEQCVYPNITRIQHSHFPKEDAYIYSQYVFFYPLEDVIGEDNLKIAQNDPKSMDYISYQYKKFKSKKANPMEPEQCEILRKQARDDLAVIKGEHRTAMVEEKTDANAEGESKKTGQDRVATNDNKFFFDIIKWGAMLML